jgi:ParB-like chromosome segregation protein Spo0J
MSKIKIHCKHEGTVAAGELVDHPRNPNTHPPRQVQALAKFISRVGWRHPVVVSARSGHIVAGPCRKLAALELGCDVPVDMQDFADEGEELALLLADNMIPELAEMNEQLRDEGIESLEEFGYEPEELGFSFDTIDADGVENINIAEQKNKIQSIALRPYNKVHLMLSFSPEVAMDVLEKIKGVEEINTVELEQSSN